MEWSKIERFLKDNKGLAITIGFWIKQLYIFCQKFPDGTDRTPVFLLLLINNAIPNVYENKKQKVAVPLFPVPSVPN